MGFWKPNNLYKGNLKSWPLTFHHHNFYLVIEYKKKKKIVKAMTEYNEDMAGRVRLKLIEFMWCSIVSKLHNSS